MSKALRLLFGLCLLPCSTPAYPATNNIAVSGMGAASCAEFLQQVGENPDMENIYFTSRGLKASCPVGTLEGWRTKEAAMSWETDGPLPPQGLDRLSRGAQTS